MNPLPLLVGLAGALASSAPTAAAPEPRLFAPGVVSTGDFEQNASFSPDGKVVYFAKVFPDFSQSVICSSTLQGGRWSAPKVAPFSGVYDDTDPALSPDGKRLFFISKRPVTPGGAPRADFDLWTVARQEAGWGEPVHLDAGINSDADEYYPSVARNGNLYFASERPGGLGQSDLYVARWNGRGYAAPEPLGPAVSSALSEHDAFVDPDERFLIFIVRGAPEGLGGADLFVSERRDGQWQPRRHLAAPLNSAGWDWCPSLSPDGRTFYFSSSRRRPVRQGASPLDALREPGNGLGDIYQVPVEALGLRP